MSATIAPVVLPPDSYDDVYDGALCFVLYGDVPVELCGSCPVRERCNALYEDLQFGSLAYASDGDKLDSIITGVWGGHTYEQEARLMRDDEVWPVKDRPERPSWA